MKHYVIEVYAEPEEFRLIINNILDWEQEGTCKLRSFRTEETEG